MNYRVGHGQLAKATVKFRPLLTHLFFCTILALCSSSSALPLNFRPFDSRKLDDRAMWRGPAHNPHERGYRFFIPPLAHALM
jgi:hypothetical protein